MSRKVFGVLVTSREALGVDPTRPMTKAGERFWACVEPEGWVEATSSRFCGYDKIPEDAKTFASRAAAEKFAKRWKGHPWWCVPNGEFDVVELRPCYREVLAGHVAKKPPASAIVSRAAIETAQQARREPPERDGDSRDAQGDQS